ncbi:MAG: NADH-quinone oxidoreductase subunit NuoF [Kiritimatiellia bacterium]|nr:NADH-quinone oxidoreductase subunit NuoF [Kiritimatiellia bacterium]
MNFEDIRKRALQEWQEFQDPGKARILIGTGTCGRAAGADQVLEVIQKTIVEQDIEATVSETGCIGLCYAEPLVELQKPNGPRVLYGNLTEESIGPLLTDFFSGDDLNTSMALATTSAVSADDIPPLNELPMLKPQVRVVLKNCGVIDPENIDHYIASGGYAGLDKALQMEPEQIIAEVKASGLRGRGGAGFSTGTKWEFCRRAESDIKYMICNADEGDPGAFMDRSVIESDPHAVLEGLIIAAIAIGAEQGYIYVRAEYPLAIQRLETAMEQARQNDLLGDHILGSDLNFHLQIKKGAGAFVCGEETALLASIEGTRGMPRSRPPFPAQSGLYGKPTNINNVETLANVPVILREGSDQFSAQGTEKSRGTKTFALAGKVTRTGLVEVPLGISVRDIVFGIGGGIPGGKEFKAVQTGGPSGGCIPAELLDTPVDYEKLAEAGAIMGSGGLVVMDEDTCMVEIARYFVNFTQEESCGKCVPCRLGTHQMLQILQDITSGGGSLDDIALLEEIGHSVRLGSLCGLGQTAPNPVLTTIRYFRDEYEAHINDSTCPAGTCERLLSYSILPDNCVGCGACIRACPVEAITGEKKEPHLLGQALCIKCGACFDVCKFDAVLRE